MVGHAPLAHEHAAHERGGSRRSPRRARRGGTARARAWTRTPRGGVVRLPRERLGGVDVKPRVRAADARLVLVIPGTQHRGCGGVVRLTRRQTIGRRRTRGILPLGASTARDPATGARFFSARTAARRLGFAPRLLRGRVARARRPRRAVARSLVGLAHPGARRRSRRPRRPARDCEAERGGTCASSSCFAEEGREQGKAQNLQNGAMCCLGLQKILADWFVGAPAARLSSRPAASPCAHRRLKRISFRMMPTPANEFTLSKSLHRSVSFGTDTRRADGEDFAAADGRESELVVLHRVRPDAPPAPCGPAVP